MSAFLNTRLFLRALLMRPERTAETEVADIVHVRMLQEMRGATATPTHAQTWRDLQGERLFRRFDRSLTPIGRQHLYYRLHEAIDQPLPDDDMSRWLDRLAAKADVRQQCQGILSSLSGSDLQTTALATEGALPLAGTFVSSGLALHVFLAISIFIWVIAGKGPPILILPVLAAGIIMRALVHGRIHPWLSCIRSIAPTMQGHRTLDNSTLSAEGITREGSPSRGLVERLSKWLAWTAWQDDDPRRLVMEYVVLAVPLDLASAALVMNGLPRIRRDVRVAYDAIGAIDVACGVLALRDALPVWSRPLVADRTIRAIDLFHPLVTDAKPISVTLSAGAGFVLTGAHMSGKSTLLRSLGTAVLMANAIRTVTARDWSSPRLHVATLMATEDQLEAGRSLHQFEAESIVDLMRKIEEDSCGLVLLDEPLRGTNSIERRSITCAVVKKLSTRSAFTVVATHDEELQSLLEGVLEAAWIDARRVSETNLLEGIDVRPGKKAFRTALPLLIESGASPEIIRDALDFLEKLTSPRTNG